jgi:hypothetical protein
VLLAADSSCFQNFLDPEDVTADGIVAPLDVLAIINRLNGGAEGEAGTMATDVNGDGQESPMDALMVINRLNNGRSSERVQADIDRIQSAIDSGQLPDGVTAEQAGARIEALENTLAIGNRPEGQRPEDAGGRMARGGGNGDSSSERVQTQSTQGDCQCVPEDSLTEEQVDELLFVREEEKLARDVYLALAEKWNEPIFTNIAQSEQRHMDAVGQLIAKYGLEDPVTDDTSGVLTDATLQQLYNDLVSSADVDLGYLEPGLVIEGGGTSLLAAYKTGAFIEEFDILDIQRAVLDEAPSDVENVYEHLLRGSRNHLRSFVGQIEATGEEYEPVVMTGIDPITGEDLDILYLEIITGGQETANGQGSGLHRMQDATQSPWIGSEPTAAVTDQWFAGYGRRSGGKR